MSSNAPGQLLGYVIQFPRALFHLLSMGQGDCVCIEYLGDVALLLASGNAITEEDKSSIVGNPLTDRSTDLWKTFSNWIDAIENKNLTIEKTQFVLFTNKKGRQGIIDKFHNAKTDGDVNQAIDDCKAELSDITDKHDIWVYYDNVVNKHGNVFAQIIKKFELEIKEDYGYESIKKKIREKHIPESQIEFSLRNISGWLQKVVINKISQKQNAIISWEEFDKEFMVLFDRSRTLELVDFALQNPPNSSDVHKQIKQQPLYLKQLIEIELENEDEIIEAVTDYMRAKVNRGKWIEADIIDETVAQDFETKLTDFWNNKRRELRITNKNLGDAEFGQLLYTQCKMRIEKIRDMDPPAKTISGTYQALADEPLLGWHPKWEQSFKK